MEESSEEDLTAVGRFTAGHQEEEEGGPQPPGPPPQFADSPLEEEAPARANPTKVGDYSINIVFLTNTLAPIRKWSQPLPLT